LSSIPAGSRGWELLSDFSKYERPAKIEYVLKRVRELANQGKKVVVWSAFVRNVQLLESKLSDLGAVTIYGAIETGDEDDAETREWRLREFHESDACKILIANPAAGGEGISLHRVCHNAIYLDRTFNAAHYLQSVDRIHRLGLDRKARTEVEVLQAENTIDRIVDDRVNDKIRAMAAVLDDRDLRALAYDPFDVIEENPAGIDKGDELPIVTHLKES
jgi:SNF2 family DNA or RNA helicase